MSKYNRKYLSPALLLMLLAMAFHFGPHGVVWMWRGQAPVAVLLALTSVALWTPFFASRRRLP